MDWSLVDERMTIADEDAYRTARELALRRDLRRLRREPSCSRLAVARRIGKAHVSSSRPG